MKKDIKFGIVTPTFNRAHVIERAVKSILNQSYTNWEMIIVDDGSTDNTEEIISKYTQKYPHKIKYFKLDRNYGVHKARNVAVEKTSDDVDFIVFLDSDDELLPDALEKIYKKIKEFPNIGWFCFSTIYENGKPACKVKKDNLIGDYPTILGKSNLVSGEFHPVLSRNILLKHKFPEDLKVGYVSLLWWKLAKKGYKCLYSTTITRVYHTSEDSICRPKKKTKEYFENMLKGTKRVIDLFGEDLLKYNIKEYAKYLYAYANAQIVLGYKKEGIKNTFKAFFIKPDIRFIRNLLNIFGIIDEIKQ